VNETAIATYGSILLSLLGGYWSFVRSKAVERAQREQEKRAQASQEQAASRDYVILQADRLNTEVVELRTQIKDLREENEALRKRVRELEDRLAAA
jgi:septal ring factor EnvC (AmiA/AmiB activator)